MASTAALLAAEVWKTITLGGDPDFTIEVPSAAKLEPQSKNPDEFMFLQAQARGNGLLWCLARRFDYSKGVTQADYAKALATPRREIFCSHDGAKDTVVLTSSSFDHNGMQAATCAASYTDPKDKERPGHVQTQMLIAAPNGMYQLTCTVEDTAIDGAEFAWEYFWRDALVIAARKAHARWITLRQSSEHASTAIPQPDGGGRGQSRKPGHVEQARDRGLVTLG